MIDKVVKARKPHKCYICERIIKEGDLCQHLKGKVPRFDDYNETQIGIEYVDQYYCKDYSCVEY